MASDTSNSLATGTQASSGKENFMARVSWNMPMVTDMKENGSGIENKVIESFFP